MKKQLFLLLSLLIGAGFTVAAQDKVIKKIIEIAKTDNRAMDHLDVLSNRIGGRPVGSDAYTNAENWVYNQFKSWGMDVELDYTGSVPVGFNRGMWRGRLLGDEPMTLNFVTPSYTSGTKGKQVGHVLKEPRSRREFETMKGRLKGAWVLINGESDGWPIDWAETGDKRRDSILADNDRIAKENQEIARRNWENKEKTPIKPMNTDEPALFYKEMLEAGVLGFIQSAPVPITALYDRKNLDKLTFETLPTVPEIKLDENQFEKIARMVDERRTFFLEFEIRNHFKPGPVKYHSVIGSIKGSKYPDEYVILSAHLDSYDAGTGGVDDGSGVAPVMEAARLLMAAGAKPLRTILFTIWSGEEFGLLGSKSWVERNLDKMPKISNVINRDGGPTPPTGMTVSEAMWDDMVKITKPLNDINPDFPFTLEKRVPRPRPTTAGGSDHAYFALNGVPTISFNSQDVKGYNFSYREIWHTDRDLYTISIPEYQEHAAVVTAITALGMANLNHLLPREGYYLDE